MCLRSQPRFSDLDILAEHTKPGTASCLPSDLASPVVEGRVVYVGSVGGNLYALM